MAVGEPFGLWVIERKGEIGQYIPEGKHHVDVILTEDPAYYKKRKVRVLNGSHTNLVPAGLWEGETTVYDCMKNPAGTRFRAFLLETLDQEIVPFVSEDIAATKEFSDSVLDRFENPYLNHQLTAIQLNSFSKWRARNLPSFRDYVQRYGHIPPNMTKGFAYLVQLYKQAKKQGDGYISVLPGREIPLMDEEPYLSYFSNGRTVASLMRDETIWGEDLTRYEGFLPQVEGYLNILEGGGSLL